MRAGVLEQLWHVSEMESERDGNNDFYKVSPPSLSTRN